MTKFSEWSDGMIKHAAMLRAAADRGYYRDRPPEEVEDCLRRNSELLGMMLSMLRAAVEMPEVFRQLVETMPSPPKPALRLVTDDDGPDAA